MSTTDPDETRAHVVPDTATLSRDPAFMEYAAQLLHDAELAYDLTAEQAARLAAIGQLRQFGSGELICDEHERSDELYVVEHGVVEVWLDPASVGEARPARQIATIQTGQTCGDLALIDGGVRSARMVAGPNGAKLMAFQRDALLTLCEQDTAIGYRLMRNLAASLALRLRLQDMRLYSA